MTRLLLPRLVDPFIIIPTVIILNPFLRHPPPPRPSPPPSSGPPQRPTLGFRTNAFRAFALSLFPPPTRSFPSLSSAAHAAAPSSVILLCNPLCSSHTSVTERPSKKSNNKGVEGGRRHRRRRRRRRRPSRALEKKGPPHIMPKRAADPRPPHRTISRPPPHLGHRSIIHIAPDHVRSSTARAGGRRPRALAPRSQPRRAERLDVLHRRVADERRPAPRHQVGERHGVGARAQRDLERRDLPCCFFCLRMCAIVCGVIAMAVQDLGAPATPAAAGQVSTHATIRAAAAEANGQASSRARRLSQRRTSNSSFSTASRVLLSLGTSAVATAAPSPPPSQRLSCSDGKPPAGGGAMWRRCWWKWCGRAAKVYGLSSGETKGWRASAPLINTVSRPALVPLAHMHTRPCPQAGQWVRLYIHIQQRRRRTLEVDQDGQQLVRQQRAQLRRLGRDLVGALLRAAERLARAREDAGEQVVDLFGG